MFDVYYQVAVEVSGPHAAALLDQAAVNHVGRMTDGIALYTSFRNERGGMIDDLTVFRLTPSRYWLLCTPSRVEMVVAHLEQIRESDDVWVANLGYKYAYLSVQGPNSRVCCRNFCRQSALMAQKTAGVSRNCVVCD